MKERNKESKKDRAEEDKKKARQTLSKPAKMSCFGGGGGGKQPWSCVFSKQNRRKRKIPKKTNAKTKQTKTNKEGLGPSEVT